MKKQIDEIITDKNTLQEMLPFAQFYAGLTTKQDLYKVETSLKQDIKDVRDELKNDIKNEIKKVEECLQKDIKNSALSTQIKMYLTIGSATIAIITLLPLMMKWIH